MNNFKKQLEAAIVKAGAEPVDLPEAGRSEKKLEELHQTFQESPELTTGEKWDMLERVAETLAPAEPKPRKEKKKKKKHIEPVVRTRPRCNVCGFRIRGSNHVDGQHHQLALEKKKGK